MREIKFRGKSIKKSTWLYGNIQVPKPPFDEWFMWDENVNQCKVDKETVGQYTGLKDRNGIEIYEGDIIRLHTSFTTSSQDRLGRIIFRHGAYILKYNAIEWESLVSIWHKGEIEVEVIGNVEENIDLLLEN